jgi:predicted  nucleic acid-binding Zn-ribbon protein
MKTLQQQETEVFLSMAEGMRVMQQSIANLESQLETAMEMNKKLFDLLADKQKEIDDMKDLLACHKKTMV